MLKKTNLNKYCFYLMHVLYKIPINHALFCYVFFLFLFECLQEQGLKFSTYNQTKHNTANTIGI